MVGAEGAYGEGEFGVWGDVVGALRRVRVVAGGAVVVAGVLMVVPAVLVGPVADPAPVLVTAGAAAGLVLVLLPHLCVARRPFRRHGGDLRYLTARTWSGTRTLDLWSLRGVRTWKEVWRGGSETYLVLTDAHGTRLAFSTGGSGTVRMVRRYAVERPRRHPDAPAVRLTRLALADLGSRPLHPALSALRSLLALERTVLLIVGPMMVSAFLAMR